MGMTKPYYFLGLMSGTSLDAVDAAIVDFSASTPKLHSHYQHPLPADLRSNILMLCTPGENEIERLGKCDVELGQIFASAALQLLQNAEISADQIQAIGCHGQTIRHSPKSPLAFTLQIGDPNVIAHITGITTIADFRRRDIAAGGQGAPLAPAFHREVFSTTQDRAILNIGGMANLTLLPADTRLPPIGFDTGPGNVLIDAWYQIHQQGPYDTNGAWAAGGKISSKLLELFLTDAYFQLVPPKSTGRELFNRQWLEQRLTQLNLNLDAQDVCATLVELSAITISNDLDQHFSPCRELFVCGGGAHNGYLLSRLAAHSPQCKVGTTADLGVDPDWVEAIAFAWLAKQRLEEKTGNLTSITGAAKACILGGIYHA